MIVQRQAFIHHMYTYSQQGRQRKFVWVLDVFLLTLA